MDNKDTQSTTSQPAPETLQVASDETVTQTATTPEATVKKTTAAKKLSYRPSHKSTFIGIAVVVLFLAVNMAGIAFLMRSEADAQEQLIDNGVTLSSDTLSQLGVNREPAGEATELTVGPNSTFRGNVDIGKDVSIGGNLQLNSAFVANEARLTNLQAGEVQLEELNVNGDGTFSTLSLRQDLTVVGTSRLQGQLVVSGLATINNSLNVAGNLAVGGTLSARTFEANNLTSGDRLTVGGHIITRGNAPGVSRGGAVGSNGTVSISGSDTAGTVAVNIGVGASAGVLASVSFVRNYDATPRVVVTPIGRSVPGLYVNRTAAGFTISTSGALSPGGYAFDYIIMQ